MARSDFGFQIGSALATNYLTDSKFIRGGYITVDTIAERDALPVDSGSGGVIVNGCLCYVTATEKFYKYNNGWAEAEFGGGNVDDVKINGTSIVTDKVADITVTDNVTSTSTTAALSANMGKSLQDQINNLENVGRFLSIWNAATGTPASEPTVSPYSFRVGDYYRVGTAGTKNPANNATYTTGGTNWVEGEALGIGDVVYVSNISGETSTWVKQGAGGGGTVQDVQVNGTSVVASGTGVANIPIANGTLGAVKINSSGATGISINSTTGDVGIVGAGYALIQESTNSYRPITPNVQTISVKKALGNTVTSTTSNSSWTDTEKSTARTTLGAAGSDDIPNVVRL